MQSEVLLRAALLSRRNRTKRRWYRVMVALAAVVVFITTYALILPAITLTNTVVATVSNEAELRDAINTYDDGIIRLSADFSCFNPQLTTNVITIPSGKDLCIDLNGHTIVNEHPWGWDLFEVSGTLTIDDSATPTVTTTKVAPVSPATATYNSSTNQLTYYVDYNNDTTIQNVVDLQGRLVQTGGYNLISVKAGGTLNVVDGTLCMSGGANSNNVIYGATNSTVNIIGGYVTSDRTANSNGGLINSEGTVNMSGGAVLAGGTAASGGAVEVGNNGTFNMTGGTISGNTSTNNDGAAIHVSSTNSHVNVTGGVITANAGGDAISAPAGADVNVTVGVPDGVTVVQVNNLSELTTALARNDDIYIMLMDDIDVPAEIPLTGSKTVDLYGHTLKMTSSADRIVRVETGETFTVCDTSPVIETVERVARLADDGTTLLDGSGNPVYGYEDALDYVDADGRSNYRMAKNATYNPSTGEITYYVLEPVVVDPSTGDTTEYLYRHTVSACGMLTTDNAAGGRPITVDGGTVNVNSGFLAFCHNGVINNDDRMIDDVDHAYNNGGTININGGVMCGNTAGSGGVIDVTGGNPEAPLTLNINGGVMSGNVGDANGGAIRMQGGGQLNMAGGILTNNDAPGTGVYSGGGAILIGGGVNMVMSGGVISGNSCRATGGGVVAFATEDAHTSFTIEGANAFIVGNGVISDQGHEGGGVSILGNALGYFNQGYINNNITTTNQHWGGGGAFVAEGGNAFVKDTLMTNNTAGGFGGGIGACSTGHLLVEAEHGLASFDNTAGCFGDDPFDHLASSESSKHSDLEYGYNNPVFMANERDDVYSALSATVSGRMLGGGSADWEGSVDGRAVMFGGDETITSTSTVGLTSHADDAAKNAAKAAAKMYFNGNNSYHHAGAMLVNGQMIAGSSESIDIGVLMIPTTKKTLYDPSGNKVENLTDYPFTFSIYNVNGTIVSSGITNSDGTITFDRRLVFDHEGVYWFYVKEEPIDAEAFQNVVYDPKVYLLRCECYADDPVMLDEHHYQIKYRLREYQNVTKFDGSTGSSCTQLWVRTDGEKAINLFPNASIAQPLGTESNGWTYKGFVDSGTQMMHHDFEIFTDVRDEESSGFVNYLSQSDETKIKTRKVWNDPEEKTHATDTVEMVLQRSSDDGDTWTDVDSVDLGRVNLLQEYPAASNPYTASSSYNNAWLPELAFDGDISTKWQPNPRDYENDEPQPTNWLMAEMDDVYPVSQVNVTWGNYCPVGTGIIEVSTDGTNWTTVATGLGGERGKTDTVIFTEDDGEGNEVPVTVDAKFIRLTVSDTSHANVSGEVDHKYQPDVLEMEAYGPFDETSWQHEWTGLPVTGEEGGETVRYTYRVVERTITEHGSLYVPFGNTADEVNAFNNGNTFHDAFIIVSPDKSKQLILSQSGGTWTLDEYDVTISGAATFGGVDYSDSYSADNVNTSYEFIHNITERAQILTTLSQNKRIRVADGAGTVINTYDAPGNDVYLDSNGHLYFVDPGNNNGNINDTPRYYLIYNTDTGFTFTTDAAQVDAKGVLLYEDVDRVMDADGVSRAGHEPTTYVTTTTVTNVTTSASKYIPATSILSDTPYIIVSPDGTQALRIQYGFKDEEYNGMQEVNNDSSSHRNAVFTSADRATVTKISGEDAYDGADIEALGPNIFFQKSGDNFSNVLSYGYIEEWFGYKNNGLGDLWVKDENSSDPNLGASFHTAILATNPWIIHTDAAGRLYLTSTNDASGNLYYIVYKNGKFDVVSASTEVMNNLERYYELSQIDSPTDEQIAEMTSLYSALAPTEADQATLAHYMSARQDRDAYIATHSPTDGEPGYDKNYQSTVDAYNADMANDLASLISSAASGSTFVTTQVDPYAAKLYGPQLSDIESEYIYTVTNTPIEHQTYSLSITKVNKQNPDVLVANVRFRLVDANGDFVHFTYENGFYHYDETEDGTVDLVTDTYGRIQADGLPAGTYTLREIEAPFGYKLASDRTFTCAAEPEIEFTIEDPYNTTELPATGGPGRGWIYLLATLLLVGAPLLYLYGRGRRPAVKTDR